MKSSLELQALVPYGLETEEYVQLAMLCLDQAGLPMREQERLELEIRKRLRLGEGYEP